jgi:hypothetical protein
MKKSIISSIATISILLFANSCKKDDHNHGDHDSINKVTMELTSASGNATLTFEDKDGDGGAAPTIIGGSLKSNTTYTGVIRLYHFHETSYEEKTSEISSEGAKHQFFFSSTVAGISFTYADKDASNNPIGLASTVKTVGSGTGVIKVILKHEPNKSAAGVAAGDVTNAGGETDAEMEFPITVI